MSMPQIPGYTIGDSESSLATLWTRPAGDLPTELWPYRRLLDVDANPTGWVVVEEHFYNPQEHGGRGCVLVEAGTEPAALEETDWIGREVGDFGVWTSPDGSAGYDNGLTENRGEVDAEFFVQVRQATGASLPQVEVSHPFLWFWDAYAVQDGWRYVSASGREHELIRYERTQDAWKVEVHVQELRTFLLHYDKSAIVQLDYVTKDSEGGFERVDSDFHNAWAHVDFHAVADFLTGSAHPSMSRVFGQYVLSGQKTARRPRWESFHSATDYPAFIYGIDPETGQHAARRPHLGVRCDYRRRRVPCARRNRRGRRCLALRTTTGDVHIDIVRTTKPNVTRCPQPALVARPGHSAERDLRPFTSVGPVTEHERSPGRCIPRRRSGPTQLSRFGMCQHWRLV